MLFTTLVMGVSSCDKEEINVVSQNPTTNVVNVSSNNYPGVSIEKSMLKFNSVEDYYAIVNAEDVNVRIDFAEYVSNLKFNNYFSAENAKKDEKSNQTMDDFFGKLLNEKGCIQIGNHVLKIDLLTERAYAVELKNWNENVFENGNRLVQSFTFDDDVLAILNDPTYNNERCSNVQSFNIPTTALSGTLNEFMCTLKLFKAGIYYRVTGRTTNTGNPPSDYTYTLELMYSTANIRRKPCSNSEVTSHLIGAKKVTTNVSEAIWEAYSKSWNVKEIYMYMRSTARFGNPSDQGFLLGYTDVIGVNL